MTNLKTLPETASELAARGREAAEELGRSAASKIEEARVETGGALHRAAASVREKGRKGSEAIDNFTATAADRLDASAEFVEHHDLRDALNGLARFGSRHLGACMVGAAAIGFFVGSALTRATRSLETPPIG
jgi:hypothetical protein